MNLLSGLLIVLCLIVLVSAESHQNRRQKFKVFKQQRLNPDNLGRRGNYRDTFKWETVSSTLPTSSTGTSTATPATTTPPASPTRSSPTVFNKNKINEDRLKYDELVNRFDQEDLDDMIELHRLRRRKNRRQSGLRRHRHRQ